jgi:phytoene desaturase
MKPTVDPVVVIGAGFGGLAAAVRLRARGYPVIVLEAGPQAGGRARVFREGGFAFDAGPTVITAPYLLEELFTLLGRDPRDFLNLAPVDPYYRVMFPDGAHFDYVGEEERILQQIAALSPADVDGYRRLAEHARQIFDIGYTQLAHVPFDRFWDMMRIVPDMVRLQNYRSVYSLVSKYIRDERLRQVFTFQPLLIGGNPTKATSIYLLIHWLERKWGVHFARGGTGAIVAALVALLEEAGVQVRLNSPVERIEVQEGQTRAVITASGERIPCSMVVANADPVKVYGEMIDAEHRPSHSRRSLQGKKQSMSLFVMYMGTKKRWEDVAHHTIVLGPRYQGLLDDIFENQVLAQDFSLYLHAPTRSDPNIAPAGKEALYVLSPVPNLRKGLVDWEQRSEEYGQRIQEELERRVLPGLGASIEVKKTIDPRYFRDELRSTDGAAFGIEPLLQQSAWFRFHNRSEDVRGLYFVGASTHPGAGVPGVLCTARVLDQVVPELESQHGLPIPPARAAG